MRLSGILEGAIVGAIGMYFFDPSKGHARRVQMRDRMAKRARTINEDLEIMRLDFSHRATGLMAEARQTFNHNHVTNEVLEARIRSNLGRHVSNVGAISVVIENGEIRLTGDVLADEVNEAVRCARRVAGSKPVRNELSVHERKEHFPNLRGQKAESPGEARWAPATSLLMSSLGAGLVLAGAFRRGTGGGIMIACGAGMIGKAFSEVEHRNEPTATNHHSVGPAKLTGIRSLIASSGDNGSAGI